jgi:hypothetical protein
MDLIAVKTSEIPRIIELADERGEFVYLEDGFLYYEPKGVGCISSNDLRILANELDKRNKKWSDEIDAYFVKEKESDGQRARRLLDGKLGFWYGKTLEEMTDDECYDCLKWVQDKTGVYYI